MNKYRIYRDLALARREEAAGATSDGAVRLAGPHKTRPELTWRDHLALLLNIGAEIEHSLMVQYLYAAYSLGGMQVPPEHRPMVAHWQESILAVAKEEMGHFLTVQNILTLIGAPINLERQNLPWDGPFYPFSFQLEPLTLNSLARYVYAEMPAEGHAALDGDDHPRRDLLRRITQRAIRQGGGGAPHRVGELYEEIIELIADTKRIPEALFQEQTFASQADSDDWGRGHQPDPRLLDAGGSLKPTAKTGEPSVDAHVMIDRVATRGQAIDALKALAAQGEAPTSFNGSNELCHFDRFVKIYEQFENHQGEVWQPARCVPLNPTTLKSDQPDQSNYISAKHSWKWASLFNLRYRMLLRYLAHTFRLARVTRGDSPNLRAMVMHRVFGEMYNLKTIAGILVRSPMHDDDSTHMAGPPFELPYTSHLPETELDIWNNHRDLMGNSEYICIALRESGASDQAYLSALIDLDSQARAWTERIIAGLRLSERPFA